MIGLLPASGRAARMKGIPKFLLPTITGELLIEYHVRLMKPHVDEIRICTSWRWFETVIDLDLEAVTVPIPPSTMNAAVLDLHGGDNLIGMPDTFFTGDENPYEALAADCLPVGVALWHCDQELRGKVGQVDYRDGRIWDVCDKDPHCAFPQMWGALRLNADAIGYLDPEHDHPGIDLPQILDAFPYAVTEMQGRYIDCGTVQGLREMLNSERLAE